MSIGEALCEGESERTSESLCSRAEWKTNNFLLFFLLVKEAGKDFDSLSYSSHHFDREKKAAGERKRSLASEGDFCVVPLSLSHLGEKEKDLPIKTH